MSLTDSVRSAVAWRSGSQIISQMMSWVVTLAVIRLLDPADYGLFAMTQVFLNFAAFLNGADEFPVGQFDYPSQIHNCDPVCNMTDHAQIV